MKSETIEVAFRYRIRYDSTRARLAAIRLAKEGVVDTVSVGEYGTCGAKRLCLGRRVKKESG